MRTRWRTKKRAKASANSRSTSSSWKNSSQASCSRDRRSRWAGINDAGYSMFNVVLVEPEIPPNTGNIGRLCLATGSRLHLVKPLGFSLEDRQLKRAGLDYWDEVDVRTWDSLAELKREQSSSSRYFFLTTKSGRAYYDVRFHGGDFLVFGRETKGLPENLLDRKSVV